MNCLMVFDLLLLSQSLICCLVEHPLLKMMVPNFTLMGSIAEGARIAIANEMDLMLQFDGFENSPFEVDEGDLFHLKATEHIPYWVEKYLDGNRRFIFHKFMRDLLDAVTSCIEEIYSSGRNPQRLARKTTNEHYKLVPQECYDCRKRKRIQTKIFKQCKSCMVAVSQTKVGNGLQLLWKSGKEGEIYCSMDVVPVFQIKGILPLELARLINTAMLMEQPEGWLNYITKYAKADLIVPDLLKGDKSLIKSVLLKNLNCSVEKNYFVRPGQHLNATKFLSNDHRWVYQRIKALKSVLKIDLNTYFLKKLLLRPVMFNTNNSYEFLFDVMCQPELREKFERIIDYDNWITEEDKSNLPLKKYPMKNHL
jgi:hypothetical protein